MKSFVKLSFYFLVTLLVSILVFIESTEFIVNKKADFSLELNPKYIIVGHSHSECAFNDSLIEDFVNLSQSGESYFYTYFKIRKVLEQNPSIKVVFIEFTNNQIDEAMNNWIYDERHMNFRYPTYSPFMDISDKLVLVTNNFPVYVNSMSLSLRVNLIRVLNQDFEYSKDVGGYEYLVRDKTDSLVNTINANNSHLNNFSISDDNLAYLSHIIQYCEETNRKVVLIRSPLHEKATGYFNEAKYRELRNIRFPDVEYLDFSKFPLTNSEFGDLEHLNYKGANIFSNWFAAILNDGLLNKQNKQKYINEMFKTQMLNTISSK